VRTAREELHHAIGLPGVLFKEQWLPGAEHVGASRLVIAGGVSANSRLRQRAREDAGARGLSVHIPPMGYCTDNAAMIAMAGRWRLERGQVDPFSTNAVADLEL
jgi:N6-L-threonylcarbamoyladenine synthase